MKNRENIIVAARELFTSRGYASTSPQAIMDLANAGQGSFYHHFGSKRQLAAEVLSSVCDDLLGIGREQLQMNAPPFKRLEAYLWSERDALKGCQLGRFAYDNALEEQELREPTRKYFLELEHILIELFVDLETSYKKDPLGEPEHLAACVLAVIQGGYVLSRIHNDPSYLGHAIAGLNGLLGSKTNLLSKAPNKSSRQQKKGSI